MSACPCTLLIDTSIWLDYYLGDRPQSVDAKDLFTYAEEMNITLAYTATSLKDVFNILQREFEELLRDEGEDGVATRASFCNKVAWSCIRHMAQMGIAIPVGEPQIWLANHYEDIHNDFEDDLILAVLETSKVDFLVTGDEVLRKKAPVGAYDAAGMLVYLRTRQEAGI